MNQHWGNGRWGIAVLLFAGWSSTLLAAEAPSQCSRSEQVAFNCHIGKKLLSLCMAKPQAGQGGYMQYRFGPLNRPELVFPMAFEPPAQIFFYSAAGYAGGGEGRVRFSVDAYDYLVYSKITSGPPQQGGYRAKDMSAGLVVLHNKKPVGHFRCAEQNADFNFPDGYLTEENFNYDVETP